MDNRKINEVRIQYHDLIVDYERVTNGEKHYICDLVLKTQNRAFSNFIGLSEKDLNTLMKMVNVNSIEELNGHRFKVIYYVINSPLTEWPIFLAIGLDNTYIMLRDEYKKEDNKDNIYTLEELYTIFNNPIVHDFTLDKRPMVKSINSDN